MGSANRNRRCAITLVETLIAIAILLLLTGLLIPAIQHVRETANQARCRSNLRQIAMAAHGYDASRGALPPGYVGPLEGFPKPMSIETTGPWVGCLFLLLPHIGQNALYSRFHDTRATFPVDSAPRAGQPLQPRLNVQQESWWVDPANMKADTGGARVHLFECPSDDLYEPVDRVFPAYYAGGAFGRYTFAVEIAQSASFDTRGLGRTNYVGVAGLQSGGNKSPLQDYDGRYDGVLTSRSRVSLAQVANHDGTSNTLMFGEALGGSATGVVAPHNKTARGNAFSWVGVGCLSTGWGIVDSRRGGRATNTEPADTVDTGIGPFEYFFSSRHPNGAYFAFADGSVHLLRFEKPLIFVPAPGRPNHFDRPPLPSNTQWGLLQQLAGWRDGDRQQWSAFVD